MTVSSIWFDHAENVKMWIESIYQYADDDIAKILVANKIDMADERKVSE